MIYVCFTTGDINSHQVKLMSASSLNYEVTIFSFLLDKYLVAIANLKM